MKKTLNFNTNEMLANKSLSTIKGGGNSDGLPGDINAIINGGGETDKRPKKPTVGECMGKLNFKI